MLRIPFFTSRRKKPPAVQISCTPILDLLEPLPVPSDHIVTGRFALPFLTFVIMIVFTKNYSFLIVPFGYLAIALIDVAVHEFGHILAGWCVGLRFNGVHMGPLEVYRIRTRWAFRFRPKIHRGEAHMSLGKIRKIRRRLAIFILGGPVASYAFGISACALGESYRVADLTGWTTFLEFLGVFSIFTGLLSTIPFARGGGNDAFLLRRLICSKSSAIEFIAAYALNAATTKACLIPEYYQRWSRLAAGSASSTYKLYVHHWDLYRSAEDVAVASEHLESVLRLLPGLDEPARTYIIAEAAYFTAWQRPNEMIADVWFKRIRRLDWLGKIERCRVEIARLSLQNKNDEALKECQNTISFIQQHVDGPVSKQIESSWLKWREQIHQRVLPEPAVVSSAAGIE